jgi:hypothetical protein
MRGEKRERKTSEKTHIFNDSPFVEHSIRETISGNSYDSYTPDASHKVPAANLQ